MGVVEAIESNLFGYLEAFGRISQGQLYQTPELNWTHTGSALLNRAFAAKFDQGSSAQIDQIIEHYRSIESPVTWMTGPSTTPEHLSDQLIEKGFKHVSDWPGMALPIDQLKSFDLPQGFSSQPISDSNFDAWIQIARPCFGIPESSQEVFNGIFRELLLGSAPPFLGYLASVNGQPVCTALASLQTDVAGIYWVATPTEAQRKGYATAMTVQVLEKLNSQIKLAVLHATPAGRKVYERMGFQTHCNIGLYLWSPEN